jgi:hypothetical protein
VGVAVGVGVGVALALGVAVGDALVLPTPPDPLAPETSGVPAVAAPVGEFVAVGRVAALAGSAHVTATAAATTAREPVRARVRCTADVTGRIAILHCVVSGRVVRYALIQPV